VGVRIRGKEQKNIISITCGSPAISAVLAKHWPIKMQIPVCSHCYWWFITSSYFPYSLNCSQSSNEKHFRFHV